MRDRETERRAEQPRDQNRDPCAFSSKWKSHFGHSNFALFLIGPCDTKIQRPTFLNVPALQRKSGSVCTAQPDAHHCFPSIFTSSHHDISTSPHLLLQSPYGADGRCCGEDAHHKKRQRGGEDVCNGVCEEERGREGKDVGGVEKVEVDMIAKGTAKEDGRVRCGVVGLGGWSRYFF